jgi:dephospho-CoA kinase
MRLGLTGGIACGKSLADAFFRNKGVPVLDADELVHALQGPGGVLAAGIGEEFGTAFLQDDGAVDRRRLGQLVFADRHSLARLNAVSQPVIRKAISQVIARNEAKLAIYDLPLLFEQNYEGLFDKTLVIAAPQRLQLARLMARDGLNQAEAEQRLASQLPLSVKIKRADFVIWNDGSQALFTDRLAEFLEKLENDYDLSALS